MKRPLWIAALALTVFITGPAPRAAVIRFSTGPSCTFQSVTIDAAGNLNAICADGAPAPTPAPTPNPAPAPAPTPTPSPIPSDCSMPSNGVMQPIFPGGSNNYVYDSRNYTNSTVHGGPPTGTTVPMNTIQIYKLPDAYQDGAGIINGEIDASGQPGVDLGGQYELAFHKCPGAFYDKPDYICDGVFGDNYTLLWSRNPVHYFNQCYVPPGEQWYINWRSIGCPTDKGNTCGQVFFIPHN